MKPATIIEVPLTNPITVAADADTPAHEVNTLRLAMRRMTLGDAKMFDKTDGEIATSIAMIAHFSGLPAATVEQISIDDIDAINEAMAPFFQRKRPSRPIGKT